MNCRRCHHTHEAHAKSDQGGSMIGAGACQIPACTCRQYQDPIQTIDEELL